MKPNQKQKLTQTLAFSLLLLFSTMANTAWAQAKFYATAPKQMGINQVLQVNFVLENADGSNLKMPATPDFQVVGGPNTSTSMSWVNGNISKSVTYSYMLRPKKEGTFKIGKASITVGGVNMESNELTVEVGKAVQQQQRRDPFDDPFFDDVFGRNQQVPEIDMAELEKQAKKDVFVRLIVSRNNVYKGEMLTATYRLYFRQSIAGLEVGKAPAFEGYWSQEIKQSPNQRPVQEKVNGVVYNAVDVMKYNLYPQRAGSVPISGADFKAIVVMPVGNRSRSIFDIGRSYVQKVPIGISVAAAPINVKELPEAGKPENFSGIVGKFTYDAKLSSTNGKTDEPITYTTKISGTGNLKFVEAPAMDFPEDFEVYDPKVKESITGSENGYSGSKQYDYLLIPRQPGEYKIEVQPFSFFDPSTAKYVTLKSPEFTVTVTGEPSKNLNTNAPAAQSEVALLKQDIRYIKTDMPTLEKAGNGFYGSAAYAAALASPLLLFIGLVALNRRNANLAADVIGTKRRRALKLAKKRLAVAEKHLAKGEKKEFYNEVSRGMWGYLADKLNIDMSGLSKDAVEEQLLAKQVSADTINKLKVLLGTCDLALYAPVGEGSEMKLNYNTALNLIADLEDEIK